MAWSIEITVALVWLSAANLRIEIFWDLVWAKIFYDLYRIPDFLEIKQVKIHTGWKENSWMVFCHPWPQQKSTVRLWPTQKFTGAKDTIWRHSGFFFVWGFFCLRNTCKTKLHWCSLGASLAGLVKMFLCGVWNFLLAINCYISSKFGWMEILSMLILQSVRHIHRGERGVKRHVRFSQKCGWTFINDRFFMFNQIVASGVLLSMTIARATATLPCTYYCPCTH